MVVSILISVFAISSPALSQTFHNTENSITKVKYSALEELAALSTKQGRRTLPVNIVYRKLLGFNSEDLQFLGIDLVTKPNAATRDMYATHTYYLYSPPNPYANIYANCSYTINSANYRLFRHPPKITTSAEASRYGFLLNGVNQLERYVDCNCEVIIINANEIFIPGSVDENIRHTINDSALPALFVRIYTYRKSGTNI